MRLIIENLLKLMAYFYSLITDDLFKYLIISIIQSLKDWRKKLYIRTLLKMHEEEYKINF